MTQHALVALNTTTPVLLSPYGTHSGRDFTIQNPQSSGYIYIGGEGVSSSNYGYRISPNHAISFELPGVDKIYAVSSDSGMYAAVISISLEF